ncbi:stress enhanced protein 2 [Wolffia australiana]
MAAMRSAGLEMKMMVKVKVRGGEKRRVAVSAIRTMRATDQDLVAESSKVVLQPRVANLRSYTSKEMASEALIKPDDGEISTFFASLADYIDSSRKSQDFETLSGRLAMVAFAGTVAVEAATGSSVFHKLDVREMAEGAAAVAAVVGCAAAFAAASSARSRIGRMIVLGYCSFVDALIDNLVDGLFYDSELSDWSDEA